MPDSLQKYLDAQNATYAQALREIQSGRKTSHWMWFVFPQITGLGQSQTSVYYALQSKQQAQAYFNHEILGKRLLEICDALLKLESTDAETIFGSIDSIKLKSSMTLFSLLHETSPVFQQVLDKFFCGESDPKTIAILKSTS